MACRSSLAASIALAVVTVMAGCPGTIETSGGRTNTDSSAGSTSYNGSSGGSTTSGGQLSPDPANGARGVSLGQSATGARSIIELDWAPMAGASRYVVNISRGSAMPSDPLDEDWSSRPGNETWGTSSSDLTFVIVSPQYRYATTYYWRVTAYNADRSESTRSPLWSFTTEAASGSDDLNGGSSTGGGSGTDASTCFEPGSYYGRVVQDIRLYSGGVLAGTESYSSSQSLTINAQGLLTFSIGDNIVRSGLTSQVTDISVSEQGDVIRVSYDAYGTLNGVGMSGSGQECYTWVSSTGSIAFSGTLSVHTIIRVPQLEQESTLYCTFVKQ